MERAIQPRVYVTAAGKQYKVATGPGGLLAGTHGSNNKAIVIRAKQAYYNVGENHGAAERRDNGERVHPRNFAVRRYPDQLKRVS